METTIVINSVINGLVWGAAAYGLTHLALKLVEMHVPGFGEPAS